jgi:hypothetical protein
MNVSPKGWKFVNITSLRLTANSELTTDPMTTVPEVIKPVRKLGS